MGVEVETISPGDGKLIYSLMCCLMWGVLSLGSGLHWNVVQIS